MFRSFVYRLGRFLYASARGEVANAPESNGEYWLVEKVASAAPSDALYLDIGANRGDWSQRVIDAAKASGRNAAVIAFEPSAYTRSLLEQRFSRDARVSIVPVAFSDSNSEAFFFVGEQGAGTNSLHPASGQIAETVQVKTLDRYLAERGILHVAFAKIDVEGFDALVLEGARENLRAGKIDIVQFEYNWRWILNRRSLRDVFELIDGSPYRLGKLSGPRILTFERWHYEMDRFFEGNFVLLRKDGPFAHLGSRADFDRYNALRVLDVA